MSIEIMARVWRDFPGGGSDLLAMLAMADWSDDSGRCWPSVKAIAKKTRLQHRQAQRVVNGLIAAGYIRLAGNEHGGKPGTTRQYVIVLEKLTGVADDTGVTHDTGVADDTGVMEGRDGCHPVHPTGVTHDTLTIRDTSITTKGVRQAPTPQPAGGQKSTGGTPDGFAQFWAAFPRQPGASMSTALRAWKAINPDTRTVRQILAALAKPLPSPAPDPAAWLSLRQWAANAPEPAAKTTTAPAQGSGSPARKKAASGLTFAQWSAQERAAGRKLISDYAAVWTYAERIGLPSDFVDLAWLAFKQRYEAGDPATKRYDDWRRVFLNALRENWLKLWRVQGDEFVLTDAGKQAEREREALDLESQEVPA